MARAAPLRVALGVYLLVAAVEITRAIVAGGPASYSGGFHPWEVFGSDVSARRFRWMDGDRAYVRMPFEAAVVEIPLLVIESGLPPTGVGVSLLLEGRPLAEARLLRTGWHRLRAYAPPVLGATPTGQPVWLEVRVDHTFVPARVAAVADHRNLGLGVGEIELMMSVPPFGIGVFPPEHGDRVLRWTERRGSIRWAELIEDVTPLPSDGPEKAGARSTGRTLIARAAYPADEANPVVARFFVDQEVAAHMSLTDPRWHAVELNPSPGPNSVITVEATPTWTDVTPAGSRALGVALAVR